MINNNPEHIDEALGIYPSQSAKFDNTIKDRLKYIGGVEDMDQLIMSRQYNKRVGSVYLTMRPKGLEILLREGFKKYPYGIDHSHLLFWSIESVLDITILQEDSILGSTYMNGQILGRAYKSIGGLIGKTNAEHEISEDDILTIGFTNEFGDEQVLILGLKRQHHGDVNHYMSYNFKELYREE